MRSGHAVFMEISGAGSGACGTGGSRDRVRLDAKGLQLDDALFGRSGADRNLPWPEGREAQDRGPGGPGSGPENDLRRRRQDAAEGLGEWESFSPYSCFAEAGKCTYRYRNADGADFKVASKTVAQGKGFRVDAGPVGGQPYPDEYFEVGSFGLVTKNKGDGYSASLIKIKKCAVGG